MECFQSTAQHYTGYHQTASVIVLTFGRVNLLLFDQHQGPGHPGLCQLARRGSLTPVFSNLSNLLLVAKLGWLLLQLDAGLILNSAFWFARSLVSLQNKHAKLAVGATAR